MRLNKQQMESSHFLTREVAKYLRDLHKQVTKLEPDFSVSSHKFMLAMVGGVATLLNDFQADLELACAITGDDPKNVLMFRSTQAMPNYFELFTKYLLDGKRVRGNTEQPTGTA